MHYDEPRYVKGSITSNGGIVSIFTENHSIVGLGMSTSSLSGHNVAFEVSNTAQVGNDGESVVAGTGTWYTIYAQRTGASTLETSSGSLSATPTYGWQVNTAGWRYFRVRATAHTSGEAVWALSAESGVNTSSVVSLLTGSNTIGFVVASVSSSPGGLTSTSRLVSAAASTNSTNVKGSGGRIYKIRGYTAAAAVRYLKIYNKATAPTIGTDTPFLTIALQPTAAFDVDFAGIGAYLSSGIGYGLTTGSADADTGALTAGDVVGLNFIYA